MQKIDFTKSWRLYTEGTVVFLYHNNLATINKI